MPQLKREQIYTIFTLRDKGESLRSIATTIGCHFSTISRLLQARNKQVPYLYIQAEVVVHGRKLSRAQRGPYKFKGELKDNILALLKEGRAPAEITGRLASQGKAHLCHETIYKYIHRDSELGGDLHKLLPRCRKKRIRRDLKAKPRGQISNPISIAYRPPEAQKPNTPGHLEADTVILKNHIGAILTVVDRYTKMLYTRLLEARTAERVKQALLSIIKDLPYKPLTLTVDNGKEFAMHEQVTRSSKVPVYFCTPYSSWERGLNEQTNGLLRRYVPKKTAYAEVSPKDLKMYTYRINSMYKACLLFKSPIEFLNQYLT